MLFYFNPDPFVSWGLRGVFIYGGGFKLLPHMCHPNPTTYLKVRVLKTLQLGNDFFGVERPQDLNNFENSTTIDPRCMGIRMA